MYRRTSQSSEQEPVKGQGWEGRRETQSIVLLGRADFKTCCKSIMCCINLTRIIILNIIILVRLQQINYYNTEKLTYPM